MADLGMHARPTEIRLDRHSRASTPPRLLAHLIDMPGTARILLLCGATAAVLVAVVAVVAVVRLDSPAPGPAQGGASEPTADSADWDRGLHFAPDSGWMNDVQRPIRVDGRWQLYNLVNADYPDGNGTSWLRVTSADLVHWRSEAVAIEKFRNGLGDIETGSVVVDTADTAGFGAGAVLAVVTQQLDGVQRQSLFVSQDGGVSFESYEGNPVLENPGVRDFRDPKVIWDTARDRWVMALAEGDKVGFYASPDLKSWTYISGFVSNELGTLECPDLFQMAIDGDPDRVTWVLGVSANGQSRGGTTGYAYWTGDWDGSQFVPASDEPRWLDHGSDFYAAVTWPVPSSSEPQRLNERFAIAWMNNWAYADQVPALPSTGGVDTLVRRLRLENLDGRPTLVSQPVGLGSLDGRTTSGQPGEITGPTEVLRTEGDSYRLRLRLRPDQAGEVRVVVRAEDGTSMTLGYDAERQEAFLVRDADGIAAQMPEAYREERRVALAPMTDGTVDVDVVTTGVGTEIYLNRGVASLSSLVFLGPGERTVSVEPAGGSAEVISAEVTTFDVGP